MLWDTHMHSQYSGDSQSSQENMILSALQKNLDGICFTDHLDIDYPDYPEAFLLDIPAYTASVQTLCQKYQDKLSVHLGIELGLQPHLSSRYSDLLSCHPFDFVIGSSHTVQGFDPYFPPFWDIYAEEEGYLTYFTSILENIKAFNDFDVYGHLDYVVRYGPNQNKYYSYQKYADIIDEILKSLIEHGKGIELNTGGFKYGLLHPNPTEEIILRYRELGGEIITIGADAHKPEHVAFNFEKVPNILSAAGFQYYTVFKNRKPEFIKLNA